MPCYVIAHLRFSDRSEFRTAQAKFARIFREAGARLLAADEEPHCVEGDLTADRIVMVEFPSVAVATAFLDSPEYDQLRRDRAVMADATSVFIRGIDSA
ncbi:DUF1330 domain-containing protein [Pseudooceanicola pacificus]|nr:DUF1330 domain-containing protein [Pseudooceanicola pacificus]